MANASLPPPSGADMEYRTLGRTGLRVSSVGFGGAPIGIPHYLGHEDRDAADFQAEANTAVREAVTRGINYFDTAPGYGEGRSEHLLGEALEGVRDRVALATKYPCDLNATWEARTAGVEASLERLRTDHVEVLQLHGSLYDDTLAERILAGDLLDWADSMRATGRCRWLGLTVEGPSGGLERLLRSGRFDVLEIAYSVIYQAACDYQRAPAGVIPLAKSLGMGVTTMRPTTCGVLQRLLVEGFPQLDADAVTRLVIRFVLSTPEVDCAVVGMKRVDEVIANTALASDIANRLDLRRLHDRFA